MSFGEIPAQEMEQVKKEFGITDFEALKSRLEFDNRNIAKKGIRHFKETGEDLITGYSYGEFYDWDLYFENVYMSYFGESKYCFTNLQAFLKRQHLNGFVSRSLKKSRWYQHFKPFLAQLVVLGAKQESIEWLKDSPTGEILNEEYYVNDRTYYQRLKCYIDYWLWYMDWDKNGLPVWNSSDHSGMDNQFSRSGGKNAFRYEGVDLACYVHRELKAMALIADILGCNDDVKMYNKKAIRIAKAINEVFWDDKDGFYYDRDERTGEYVRVKSVAGFMPLFAGVASRDQAERLVKNHLLNKDEFWTAYPVPAYAKTEPDYDQYVRDHGCNWRGTTWIPTNYMLFHGLLDYGYTDVAKELARRTFEMVLEKNEMTREYYNAENGEEFGLKPFWGWSTLAYFMPFEFVSGYNPMKLNKEAIKSMGRELLGVSFNK